jgi:hypothetical protein
MRGAPAIAPRARPSALWGFMLYLASDWVCLVWVFGLDCCLLV